MYSDPIDENTTLTMKRKRRTHSAEFKARVALEAIKGNFRPALAPPGLGSARPWLRQEDHFSTPNFPQSPATNTNE